jgi:hypothetical protein
MSSAIKKGVARAIQALDGTRARRSLTSKLTDLTHRRNMSRSIERLDICYVPIEVFIALDQHLAPQMRRRA